MRSVVQTKPRSEILYRETCVVRALGEPSKYKIITFLLRHGLMSVHGRTRKVQRSQPCRTIWLL